jgi:hypothetical protein
MSNLQYTYTIEMDEIIKFIPCVESQSLMPLEKLYFIYYSAIYTIKLTFKSIPTYTVRYLGLH